MPSKSKSQARFFAAAAHDPEFAKKAGISTKAAKEWNKADEKAGTLKKGSNKPEKVKEEVIPESTMRGWMDVIQDAEVANDIDSAEEQTEISQRSPSMYQEDADVPYGSDVWDEEHADPELPYEPDPIQRELPTEPLQEMPQRFDAFADQDRDEFVDKSVQMTGKHNMVPFSEHEGFDVMQIKGGAGFVAFDKSGNQLALLSGHVSNRAVVGVKNVFVESAVAAKSNVKGVVYQMYMDILDKGYSILSDGLHSDDAIKFWTRLLSNHNVYVVGDGEVLARATPEKVHKYWSEDEASPSAELRLLLVK